MSYFLDTLSRYELIKVSSEEVVPFAPLEQIFLCPKETVALALQDTDWPQESLYLDRTICMDHDDLLSYHLWGSPAEHRKRLMCIQRTTEVATIALKATGIDAFLLAGSLLGWYRHDGGQIPWDTDGDTGFTESQCKAALAQRSDAVNIASLMIPHVPAGFELQYLGQNGLSDHPEDEFTGCDVKQMRIASVFDQQGCFTDIYMVSDVEVSECKCSDASNVSYACVGAVPSVCAQKEDILPVVNSLLNNDVAINVPHNATAVLDAYYSHFPGGKGITNLHTVPKNAAFGDSHTIVVGEIVGWYHRSELNGSARWLILTAEFKFGIRIHMFQRLTVYPHPLLLLEVDKTQLMTFPTSLDLSFGNGGFELMDTICLLGADLPLAIIKRIIASANTDRLLKLDIRGNPIDYQSSRSLLRKLNACLEHIMECNGLPVHDITHNKVTSLRLCGFAGRNPLFGIEAFGAHILSSLLPRNSSLIELDFRLNNIGVEAAFELGEACTASQVRYVNCIGRRKRPGFGTLLDLKQLRGSPAAKLNLTRSLLSSEELAFLLGYFRGTSLIELDVSYNGAVTTSICALTINCGHLRTLRRLSLAELPWTDDFVVSFVQALADADSVSLAMSAGQSPAEFAVFALIVGSMKLSDITRLDIALDDDSSIIRDHAPRHHPLVYWSALKALRSLSQCESLHEIKLSIHPGVPDLGPALWDSLVAARCPARVLDICRKSMEMKKLGTILFCNTIPPPKAHDEVSEVTRDVINLEYFILAIPNISLQHDSGSFCFDVTIGPDFVRVDLLLMWLQLARSEGVLVVLWFTGCGSENRLTTILKQSEEVHRVQGCKMAFVIAHPIAQSIIEQLYLCGETSNRIAGLSLYGRRNMYSKSEVIEMLSKDKLEVIISSGKVEKMSVKIPPRVVVGGLNLSLDLCSYQDLKAVNLCNCDLAKTIEVRTVSSYAMEYVPQFRMDFNCYSPFFAEYRMLRQVCTRRSAAVKNRSMGVDDVLVNLLRLPKLESVDLRGNSLSVEHAEKVWGHTLSRLSGQRQQMSLRHVNGIEIDQVCGVVCLGPPPGLSGRVHLSAGDIWLYEKLITHIQHLHPTFNLSMQRLQFDDDCRSLPFFDMILCSLKHLNIIDCLINPSLARSLSIVLFDHLADHETQMETFNEISIENGEVYNLDKCCEWNDLSLALAAALRSKLNVGDESTFPLSLVGDNITDYGLAKFIDLLRSGCISFKDCPRINPRSAFDLVRAVRSLPALKQLNGIDLASSRETGKLVVHTSPRARISKHDSLLLSLLADALHVYSASVSINLNAGDSDEQVHSVFTSVTELLKTLPTDVAASIVIGGHVPEGAKARRPDLRMGTVATTSTSIEMQASTLWSQRRQRAGLQEVSKVRQPPIPISVEADVLLTLLEMSNSFTFEGLSLNPVSVWELNQSTNSKASSLISFAFRSNATFGCAWVTGLSRWLGSSAKSIKRLDLSATCLGDDGVECLAKALKDLPSLEALDLRRNCITSDGVLRLVEGIQSSPKGIKLVDLGSNSIGPRGFLELAELIASKNSKITDLSLARNSLLHFTSSTRLELALQCVSAIIFGAIASESLKVLDLRRVCNGRSDLWREATMGTDAEQGFSIKFLEAGVLLKRSPCD
ncbi:hypothetical protein FOL47_008460 [Perkinsus chesapeaki]|uniref:Rhodanese domain-containing protein n=1 Tax=Perkinsus chesapeaki TaxID=330153 RepID=A0A7J6LDW8_PERCH|nr:hypothetical protein FOL47_008460 [Perkinsus chesapeaki]